ncbi:MAG: hypothetical protein A2017_13045 [Lentisphaerae bacterium GWF2_44_16]|nr:MAG: hypothetical protein A2017_13045 [Lentisphaerae bacterium GWF2_44_16]
MVSQNDTKYLLAGEGGGSKTVLCLMQGTGKSISRIETHGIASVKNGVLPVKSTLLEGIQKVLEKTEADNRKISHCYFSLGGPNQEELENALKDCLPSTEIKVGREADGDLIMACVPYFNCMAAVMAGTGTVAVGEFNGKRYFAGGWGSEFDDAGGGYRIGKDALSVFLETLDRRRQKTSLTKIFSSLLYETNINTFQGRMKIKQRIHALDRKKIASYAPEVYEHFKLGDLAATEIINRASLDIAILSSTLLPEKTGLDRIGILCLGGIFKLGEKFRNLCSAHLKKLRPECTFVFRDDFDLAKGACIMVLKMAGNADDKTILQVINE